MDSRERVLAALEFHPPDRIPRRDGFENGFVQRWRQAKDLPSDADPIDYYGMDLAVCVADESFFPSKKAVLAQQADYVIENDGWGRTIRRSARANFQETVDCLLKDKATLDRLRFEPTDDAARYTDLVQAVEAHHRAGRAVFVKIGGPFIRSSFIRGMETLLIDMAEDRPFCRDLFSLVGEHLLAIGLEELRRTSVHDMGVWIYDDMAGNLGPMFSPNAFEAMLLPVYRQIVQRLKAAGCARVLLHSDGNLTPFLDLLIEAGIAGVHPVEPKAGMDFASLHQRYRGRLAFIGGVCNSHILPRGDRGEIERHVLPIIEAGREGGVIIGSDPVGEDVSPETYDYYIRLLESHGNYG
ncbi:MAG: hypothetical protein HPY83_16000 [Anaerolineae bacterium]|nr:hypothetical protein [Anaerolineae bacterium]